MKLNDADAFRRLGDKYSQGESGLPKDINKALELYTRAAELGSIRAHYELAIVYYHGRGGVEQDIETSFHHCQLAAIGGHEAARFNLGANEFINGNINQAMKHFMIAARSGYEKALKKLGEGYKAGHVTKDDYAKTLRAYQCSVDEMKSKERAISAAQR